MKTENIKAVIFDLGGVVLNLDVEKTLIGFQKLFGDDFNILEEAHINKSFFCDYEKGHISCEKFRDHVREVANKDVPDDELITAWNAMILDFPPERIKWIKELKKQYTVCLLSNTNVTHVKAFHESFQKETPYAHPSELFDKLYYSCEMGMRKPDEDIYLAVIDDLGIEPHEAVFYDDKQENVDTANKVGINGVYVKRNFLDKSMLPSIKINFE